MPGSKMLDNEVELGHDHDRETPFRERQGCE